MKQKIKAWFMKTCRVFPNLQQRTVSLLQAMPLTATVCALVLTVVYMLNTMSNAFQWADGFGALLDLAEDILIIPIAAGMMTYIAGARWEKRNVGLIDAAQLVRIRFKEMILTGLAAGLVGITVNWLGMMMYSLVEILSVLLGWIPVLGGVITVLMTGVLWIISLAMEFVVHTALVMGMLALTADGMSGRAQMERAVSVLRGGWQNMLSELGLVFGMWIIVKGMAALLLLWSPVGAALAWNIVTAAMMVVSMTAISVIYLRQRDRQSGTSYYA